VVERHDFWPFGTPSGSQVPSDTPPFAGGERDVETSLHYFGARYADGQAGRFTSPDPITADVLRLVSPQRWNRYAYAVNNPLRYVDPDGLDALLVNFTDGVSGLGHMGIMALFPDGSGVYGGFNPLHHARLIDRGRVEMIPFSQGEVAFGPDGRPTGAALEQLKHRLAMADGRDGANVRIRHIRTSDAETAALAAYIRRVHESPVLYIGIARDCLDFCVRGLWAAGIPAPPTSAVAAGAVPNFYFQSLLLDVASWWAEWRDRPTPTVATSYCFQGIDC
jgi:RHS repeat-associated protein